MNKFTPHQSQNRKQQLLDMISKVSGSDLRPEKSLQSQIEALTQELLMKDEELIKQTQQIDRLCDLVFKYEEDISIKADQIEKLQRNQGQLELELQNFQGIKESCDNAIEQLHHVEMQKSELQEQNQQLKSSESQLLEQIKALSKNSDVLLRDAFEREKKQLHKKLLEKSKIIQDQHCQIQKLNEIQTTLHQTILKMKEDQRKQDSLIQQLRDEIENLKGDHQFNSPLDQITSPMQFTSPLGIRQASFNTHKDFDTPMRASQQSQTYQKPQSSNSLCSNFTTQESKKKFMGNFKKLTSMAVGMYSNVLDYQSLQQGSRLANELSQAKIDLTQQVSRQSLLNQEFHDNN